MTRVEELKQAAEDAISRAAEMCSSYAGDELDQLIQAVRDEEALADVQCPNCGSEFQAGYVRLAKEE